MPLSVLTTDRNAARRAPAASWLIPLCGITLLLVAKLWAARWIALGDRSALTALAFETGFVLLPAALIALLPPRSRTWCWIALDAVVSLLCIVAIVYVGEFEQAPTFAAVSLLGELAGVRDSALALLKPAYLLFFADLPFLIALAVRERRRGRASGSSAIPTLSLPRAGVEAPRVSASGLPGVGVLVIALVWVAAVSGLLVATHTIDDSIAGARQRGLLAYAVLGGSRGDSAAGIEVTGKVRSASTASAVSTYSPEFVRPSAVKVDVPGKPSGKPVDLSDPADIQRTFDELQYYGGAGRVDGAPVPGEAAGRNVIMLQVEALSDWPVGLKIDGKPVTPNLDALIAESWYVPHTVTQIGRGNTADAEFTANTSLLADRNTPASYKWAGKQIPSLPRTARAYGYDAITMHPNRITFWRRDLLYPALGFTRWYSIGSFPHKDIIGVGPSDSVLYGTALDALEKKRSRNETFLAELVTLTAHQPYYFASNHDDLELPKSMRASTTGQYLRALHLADRQLGELIARMKRNGMWDDTVLVLYGDHFGMRPYGWGTTKLNGDDIAQFTRATGRKPTPADSLEVPFVLHMPGQRQGARIDEIRSQIDIFPTLADVLGFDITKTPHIGETIFDTRERVAIMRYYVPDGTFVTSDYVFRPGLTFEDGKTTPIDPSAAETTGAPKWIYKRVHKICALNEAYLRSLPKQPKRQ